MSTNFQGATSGVQGATNSVMSAQNQEISSLLNQLALVVTTQEESSEQTHYAITNSTMDTMNRAASELASMTEQLSSLQSEQSSCQKVSGIAGIVIGSFMTIAQALSGQFLMAGVTGLFTGLSASGAITDLKNVISNKLQQSDGLDSQTANLVADGILMGGMLVLSIATVACARVATSAADSAATSTVARRAVNDVQEEAVEMTPVGASAAANANEEAEESNEIVASTETASSNSNAKVMMLLFVILSQALNSTGLAADAGNALTNSTSSQGGGVGLTLGLELIPAIAGFAMMRNLASEATANSSMLDRFLSSQKRGMLFKAANCVTDAGLLTETGSQIGQGVIGVRQGQVTEAYGREQGLTTAYQGLQNQSDTGFGSYVQQGSSELKGVNKMLYAVGRDYTKAIIAQARSTTRA